MRRLVLLVLLALVGVGTVMAQDGSGTLAATIDSRATANGLPSGNGAVSPAEQAVADAVWNEINAFNQDVSDFVSASPENAAWTDAAEQTVQNFNQQIESAPAQGDPRAQAISDAVAQYGKDIETVQAQAPFDPRAQAIADAVAQYGNESVFDPRGQAISDAVAQYGNDQPTFDPRAQAISDAVAQYGKTVIDPRAQAISDAVAQYGQEIAQSQGRGQLGLADQQRLAQTIRESASDYIDQSGTERPGIAKRHINHLVQIMVPQQELPINGYWRVRPFSMQTTGQCVNTYGDNDGPSGGDDSDPGQPLCGYANAGMLPFIVWNGDTQPYLPGSTSIYSQEPRVDYAIVQDSNGKSLGSIKMTTTTEYEVVAPDEIHVHLLIQEEGGCSMSADYVIELVTADEAVCPASAPPISTPEPTEPPPVVAEGPYQVAMPLFNDETQCNETNTPPALDEVRLLEQPDGSIIIDYGTGTQVVYSTGGGLYEYDTGMAGATRQSISLYLYDDGSGGNLAWSINAKDGNICYASHDLTLPGAATNDDSTSSDANDGSDSSGDYGSADDSAVVPLVEGTYAVTWTEFPGLACPEALVAKLPKFPQATITAADGGYTLTAGDLSYLMLETPGGYSYINFGADNAGEALVVASGGMDGNLVGSYSYFSPSGETCMNQLDFALMP